MKRILSVVLLIMVLVIIVVAVLTVDVQSGPRIWFGNFRLGIGYFDHTRVVNVYPDCNLQHREVTIFRKVGEGIFGNKYASHTLWERDLVVVDELNNPDPGAELHQQCALNVYKLTDVPGGEYLPQTIIGNGSVQINVVEYEPVLEEHPTEEPIFLMVLSSDGAFSLHGGAESQLDTDLQQYVIFRPFLSDELGRMTWVAAAEQPVSVVMLSNVDFTASFTVLSK